MGTLRALLLALFWEGRGGALASPATCALAPRLGAVPEAIRSGPRQLAKLSPRSSPGLSFARLAKDTRPHPRADFHDPGKEREIQEKTAKSGPTHLPRAPGTLAKECLQTKATSRLLPVPSIRGPDPSPSGIKRHYLCTHLPTEDRRRFCSQIPYVQSGSDAGSGSGPLPRQGAGCISLSW